MSLRIIGGAFKNRPLKSPPSTTTRPTTSMLRKAVFDICRPSIEGAHFLDLFSGTGAMGLEALSRGAAQATFVEQDPKAVRCLRENISLLDVASQSIVIQADVLVCLKRLQKTNKQFDVIYVDPPYDTHLYTEVLRVLDDAVLLSREGMLFIEEGLPASLHLEKFAFSTLKHHQTRRYGKSALHLIFPC